MKIIEFHWRIIKNTKIIEFHKIIMKTIENNRIPNENHEHHENLKIQREKQKTPESWNYIQE